jgi:hypothetical protein
MSIDWIGLTLKVISPKGILGTTNCNAVKDVFLEAESQHLTDSRSYADRLEDFLYDVSQGLEEHSDLDDKHLVATLDMGGPKSKLGIEFIYECDGITKTVDSPVYFVISTTLDDKTFGDKWHQMRIYCAVQSSDPTERCYLRIGTFKTESHLRVDLFAVRKDIEEEELLSQSILKAEGDSCFAGGYKVGNPMTIKSLRFYEN